MRNTRITFSLHGRRISMPSNPSWWARFWLWFLFGARCGVADIDTGVSKHLAEAKTRLSKAKQAMESGLSTSSGGVIAHDVVSNRRGPGVDRHGNLQE